MMLFDDYLLLALVIVTALGAVFVRDLFSGVLTLAAYSFFLALLWAGLGAVDVAFTEAVVGAGLSTLFFLVALFLTSHQEKVRKQFKVQMMALGSLGFWVFSYYLGLWIYRWLGTLNHYLVNMFLPTI